jgi:hypothetical protein
MNRSLLGLAATVALTMTVHTGLAAESAHVPATRQAAASADLVVRADRALRDYVAACSARDDDVIARTVTSDAVIEYALDEPGTYRAVEAVTLSTNRSADAEPTGTGPRISKLWIFPTNDPNVAFVHYTTGSDVRSPAQVPDSEHLAMIEMRGDRIFKMRNFTA